MTPEELTAIGCQTIHWNPELHGGFFEYYLPVHGDGRSWESTRLSVTFKGFFEEPEHDYMAWIVSPNHRLRLMHVKTIEQFQQMYELLTGRPIPSPDCRGLRWVLHQRAAGEQR